MSYKEGKIKSIDFCNKIINNEWKLFLSSYSKKDDLADCLLQGYSFYIGLLKSDEKNNLKIQKKIKQAEKKQVNLNKKLKNNT